MENSENPEKIGLPSGDVALNGGSAEDNNSQQSPDCKNEADQTAALEKPEETPHGVSECIENQFNLQDMETREMRVKIVCLEKNCIALQMEVKCAELQLEAKTKVDAQKTRLVELLDKKVQSLQQKNDRVMEMIETLLKDKNAHSNRLIMATKNMEELSAKLKQSEKLQNELRYTNQELKKMLETVEEKGTQIAKLAKEKVLKYKAEALVAQQELSNIMKSTTGTPEEGGAPNDQPSDRFQQNWKKIDDLQQQMETVLQGQTLGSDAERVTNINKDIKQELQQIRAGLNVLLNSNQDNNEKLISSFDSIRLLVAGLKQLGPEYASKSSENVGSGDKDQEISQLQERIQDFNAGITKLDDLFSTISK